MVDFGFRNLRCGFAFDVLLKNQLNEVVELWEGGLDDSRILGLSLGYGESSISIGELKIHKISQAVAVFLLDVVELVVFCH